MKRWFKVSNELLQDNVWKIVEKGRLTIQGLANAFNLDFQKTFCKTK